MLDHADRLDWQLDQHSPSKAMLSLDLTEYLYWPSFTWARVQRDLGLPLVGR